MNNYQDRARHGSDAGRTKIFDTNNPSASDLQMFFNPSFPAGLLPNNPEDMGRLLQ